MNAEKNNSEAGWTMEDDYDIDKRGVGDFFQKKCFFLICLKKDVGLFDKIGVWVLFPSSFL